MQSPVDTTTCTIIAAMTLLDDAISSVMSDHSIALQSSLNEALLQLAVNRMMEADGQDHAATVLWRMVELLASMGPAWWPTSASNRRVSR